MVLATKSADGEATKIPDEPAALAKKINARAAGESPEAVETVTPMKEKDGSWRVSGYYIK